MDPEFFSYLIQLTAKDVEFPIYINESPIYMIESLVYLIESAVYLNESLLSRLTKASHLISKDPHLFFEVVEFPLGHIIQEFIFCWNCPI